MPGTSLGEVSPSQLVGGPQTAVALTPQSVDPAVSATTAQIYAKTDKSLYHQDTTGAITNLLAPALVAGNALGGRTSEWAYGGFNFTGLGFLNSGASQNIYKGYIAKGPGSVVGASWMGAAGTAVSGTVQVYKNQSLFFTAISPANFAANSAQVGPVSSVYPAGTYTYAKNDYFDVYYSGSGSGLFMGVGLTFSEGNAYANSLSTALTANTTVAVTDNQRVWVASSATPYTLTLLSTQPNQDFYVRVVVTASAGVIIQAAANQTIYMGNTVTAIAGSVQSAGIGSTVVLYNPANTNIWMAVDLTGNWSVN